MTSVTAFGPNGRSASAGIPVQLDHRRDRCVERSFGGAAVALNRLEDDAGSERLRQVEAIARTCAPPSARSASGCTVPTTASPYFGSTSRIVCPPARIAPAACTRSPAPASTSAEHLGRKLFGERRDGEREQRGAAHGEDVVERVRRGDRAERARVVDQRREEVDREDDRPIVVEPVDRRVVRGVEPDEEVLRLGGDEPGEQRLEPRGCVLRGASARPRERGELHGLDAGTVGRTRRQE